MKKLNLKNLLQTLFLLAILLPSGLFTKSAVAADDNRQKVLKIYNWADYIDEDLLKEFPVWYKEQTGEDIEIVYQIFDMAEVMYTKIEKGQEDFDLACPTQALIQRMLANDLILPINRDFGTTTNYLHNLAPYILSQVAHFNMNGKNAADYVVPYMWGTSGILYNTNKISTNEASSWGCMWDPKNKGKMLMKDSYWDAYHMAAVWGYRNEIASGQRTVYSVTNDHTEADIAMVEEQLKALKPNLAGWEADFGKELMTKGEIWFCYAWGGDAVWAIEEAAEVGVSLAYTVPKEGSNVWFDGWVIPKYAKNVKAASYFLNYLCQPEVALRNMDVSGYSSAVATPEILETLIDSTLEETVNASYFFGPGNDSLKINPIQYPDSTVIARCALINDYLDKNEEVLDMWSRAKGDSLNSGMSVMIIAVIVLLIVFVVLRYISKSKSKRRRLGRNKKG